MKSVKVHFLEDLDGPIEPWLVHPISPYELEYRIGDMGELVVEHVVYSDDRSRRTVMSQMTQTFAPGQWRNVEWETVAPPMAVVS